MVSILSFFTGKKKSRRVPSAPSGACDHSAHSSTPTISPKARASRFLSLSHKNGSRSNVLDYPAKRASSQLVRRHSAKKDPASDLPRLALGWETIDGGAGAESSLGLEGMGGPVKLNSDEKKVVASWKYGLEDVTAGWRWFGKALRETGLVTPDIMLPGKPEVDQNNVYRLLALFILDLDYTAVEVFPSLSLHYPASPSDETSDGLWESRLLSAIQDTGHPGDFAECLRFLLHRGRQQASASNGAPKSRINIEAYRSFVESERSAGNPHDAYDSLLMPTLSEAQQSYFGEIFDLFAAIAAHSEANGMTGRRITRLYGWWVNGATSVSHHWRSLYNDWVEMGRITEHLFYAWIRSQSKRQTLPTKLLELVKEYPYGETSSAYLTFPLPPPSSFHRRALHLSLVSREPIEECVATLLDFVPMFEEVSAEKSSLSSTVFSAGMSVRDIIDDGRPGRYGQPASNAAIPRPPPVAQGGTVPPKAQSAQSFRKALDPGEHHWTLSSPGNASVIELGPPIAFTSAPSPRSKTRDPKQTPMARPSLEIDTTPSWDAFQSFGFGDSPSPKLELSPVTSNPSHPVIKRGVSFESAKQDRPAPSQSQEKLAHSIDNEEIVSVDDLFLPFVEDGRLDEEVSCKWPTFVLARLRTPIAHEGGDVEWLLVTATYRLPTPVETPPVFIQRPTSPTESTMSRSLGFFRRSSSQITFNRPRMSIFGGSRGSSSSTPPLTILSENNLSGTRPKSSPLASPSNGIYDSLVPARIAVEGGAHGPAEETAPEDWIYRAEGGAHVIFAYTGSLSQYSGRVLRVRKGGAEVAAADDTTSIWKDKLLPKLVPKDLLLLSTNVALTPAWARSLLEAAEARRPDARKAQGGSLFGGPASPVTATLMDDVTSVTSSRARKSLAIELKPKWGFLPRAGSIVPEEAVPIKSTLSRYVLHRAYKDEGNEDVYDPLDLFSGEENRMKKAVDALWGIWTSTNGVKNNWRVYVDGKSVTPSEIDSIPAVQATGSLCDRTYPLIAPTLVSTKVLDVLRRLQTGFDPIDISTLAVRYRNENPNLDVFDPDSIVDPNAAELRALVDKYLADPENGTLQTAWSLREQMISYAISAVFKDCSIFITLPLVETGEVYSVAEGAKVRIIDLDIKSVKSLKKWYELDKAIWENWRDKHQGRETLSHGVPPVASQLDFETNPAAGTPRRMSLADALTLDPPDALAGRQDAAQGNLNEVDASEQTITLGDDAGNLPNGLSGELRKQRSFAPSPSPTPFLKNLPEQPVPDVHVTEHSANSDMSTHESSDASLGGPHDIRTEFVNKQPQAAVVNDQPGVKFISGPSQGELAPESEAMMLAPVAHNQKGSAAESLTPRSGASSLFEAFSTPMSQSAESPSHVDDHMIFNGSIAKAADLTEELRLMSFEENDGTDGPVDVSSGTNGLADHPMIPVDPYQQIESQAVSSQALSISEHPVPDVSATPVTSLTGDELSSTRLPSVSTVPENPPFDIQNLTPRVADAIAADARDDSHTTSFPAASATEITTDTVVASSGPSAATPKVIDPVDNLVMAPSPTALALADFAPHSLPPVFERGESKIGQLDTPIAETSPAALIDGIADRTQAEPASSSAVNGEGRHEPSAEEVQTRRSFDPNSAGTEETQSYRREGDTAGPLSN